MSEPRRRRFRWRWVAVAAVAALLAAGGWVAWEVQRVRVAEPEPTVDYRAKLRALGERAAGVSWERGEAAWARFAEALDAVESVRDEVEQRLRDGELAKRTVVTFDGREVPLDQLDYGDVLAGADPLDETEPEQAAVALLRQRGAFERLAEIADGPPPLRPLDDEAAIDPLSAAWRQRDRDRGLVRELSQAGAASMRLALDEGRVAEVADAFDQLLALASAMSHQPDVLYYLTGVAITALACAELRYELLEHRFDEATCSRLVTSLDAYRRQSAPHEHLLAVDRLCFHDAVQRWYSDDGEGDGYLVGSDDLFAQLGVTRETSLADAFEARFLLAGRAEVVELYEEISDKAAAILKLPAAELIEKAEALERFAKGLPTHYDPLRHLMTAPPSLAANAPADALRLASTETMVLLELYRARHGTYPATLEALVPDVVDEVPLDPLNGMPFGYRPVEDDRHGRPYLLSTLGFDGGESEFVFDFEDHSWMGAALDTEMSDMDVVINQPRMPR